MTEPPTIGADQVARAIHDVASPITVLVGLCFALRRRVDDPAVLVHLGRMEGEIERISHRLDTLLATSGRSQAAPTRERGPVALSTVVREVAARSSAVAQRSGVRVVVDICEGALTVYADAGALEVALENLLANAVRHAGPQGTVWVSASRWGASAVVHVADDGPGVHPQDRARIFHPNVRGQGATGPGQGLGLAIARDTARGHGGDLILELSRSGAVFRLALPLSGAGVQGNERGVA